MQDREIQHYHIQGYGTFFEEALPSIKSTLDKKLGDKEGHFAMAIVEAVQKMFCLTASGLAGWPVISSWGKWSGQILSKVPKNVEDISLCSWLWNVFMWMLRGGASRFVQQGRTIRGIYPKKSRISCQGSCWSRTV